ncbi:MAG: O-antigen ligase family protein [Sulfuricaulis sp.]|uniref:O-antigen ligase family protein n=1 Tax=Sulfuricaulis sp. TaxID=2003553 RepID=UPI0034A40FCB
MELFLLKLVALLRPLASMEYAETLFSILGVGLFALLFAAVLMKAALNKSLRLSAVDGVIVAFAVWCIAISGIYYEGTKIAEVVKLLVPVLSYTLVKNIIPDQQAYRSLLFWIIIGFAVPTLVSALLIAVSSSTALDIVNYWTQVPRWKGVYTGAHSFGHSMTLFFITLVLFFTLRKTGETEQHTISTHLANTLFALLGIAALYGLYMSQVRTAVLGLLIFLCIFSLAVNKKVFLIGATTFVLAAIATSSYWLVAFNPELGAEGRGVEVGVINIGSGRPNLWLNDIRVFAERPIDAKLAGAGIGNRSGIGEAEGQVYGHNDWLELLTQTGLIGLLLFATLQILIFKKILRMKGREKYAFIALFIAVNFMMFVSNSYVWRIQVGQLYYMMLGYIEIRQTLNPKAVHTAITTDQGKSNALDRYGRGTG